jgi:hypothetical protein
LVLIWQRAKFDLVLNVCEKQARSQTNGEEGMFSGALKEPPAFKLILSSVLSGYRVSSHQTSSVSSNRRKVKPSGLASDDRLSFGTDGSLGTGEENTNGVTLSSILLLGRCHSVSLAKQPSP